MKHKKIFILVCLIVIIVTILCIIPKFESKTSSEAVAKAEVSKIVDLKNGQEYDMKASYVTKEIGGVTYQMLAYNNSIPGPTLRVAQGSEITIHFKNETDMPQLLHSHGVRLDNRYDGSQLVQKEVMPGETYTYVIKFPDAGVYWYHPHAGEVYGQALGLYGAFIVTPHDPEYFPKVNSEGAVFLADLPVDTNGVTIQKDDTTHSLMGHYGNIMLVNGESNYKLSLKKGEVTRMYVLNSANARPFNLSMNGLKLKLVGGDSGAYENPTIVDHIVLGPGERAIVDVYAPESGIFEMQNNTPQGNMKLGTIEVSKSEIKTSFKNQFEALTPNTQAIKDIDNFRKYFTQAPDKKISFELDAMKGGMGDMQGMGGMNHGGRMNRGTSSEKLDIGSSTLGLDGIEWNDLSGNMNAMTNTSNLKWMIIDQDTGKENMDINWELKRDVPIKIRIFNDPHSMHPMQHPMHFHGERFLITAINGVPQTNMVWKDTVLVVSGDTVDILLDPSNVGVWMGHCHISEHLVAGMMLGFSVK